MSPANGWVAGYAGVVVLSALTVLLRRESALLRGRSALLFTATYVGMAWVALARGNADIPRHAIALAGAALVLSLIAAPWWFVIGGPRADVVSTLQVCLDRVCAVYERTPAGFVMSVPAGGLHISVHALPWTRVSFVSLRAKPRHRKSDLLRNLFRKQYRGVLPTIRIRIG